MIGKRFRSLPFIFANDNYTLRFLGICPSSSRLWPRAYATPPEALILRITSCVITASSSLSFLHNSFSIIWISLTSLKPQIKMQNSSPDLLDTRQCSWGSPFSKTAKLSRYLSPTSCALSAKAKKRTARAVRFSMPAILL